MRSLTLFSFVAGLFFLFSSCNKEQEEPYQPLVFKSLMASSNSFQAGSFVGITADVEGTQITYHWSYNSGSISGGGDYINYTNEIPGYHSVICTVVDAEGTVDSKEVILQVY